MTQGEHPRAVLPVIYSIFIVIHMYLFTFILVLIGVPCVHAADSSPASPPHLVDMRFETTTYVLNLEKQGLQDNTFTNGIGRDTTLMGDFVHATLHHRLLPNLDAAIGVFADIPFGYDKEIYKVRPIVRLDYRPGEQIAAVAGTIYVPHRHFMDAVFDNANRYVRPIEQGAQVTTDLTFYRQDAFINWQQAFGESAVNRFDVGYAGQLRAGPFRFNGQAHWIQNGQALMKLDRPFDTKHNIVTAFGPELVLEPGRFVSALQWWREIGVRLTALNSYDEPNETRGGPIIRGRGYDASIWLDLAGWRPRIGFWRGTNFISQQGDPEFKVANFTELGLSKLFAITDDAWLELDLQARHVPNFISGEGRKWVNQEYLVFNWNWDTSRTDLLGDLLSSQDKTTSERRFRPLLDTFTYVYNVNYSGLRRIDNRPVTDLTFAGEYLTPVLRYTPKPGLNLDAGVFAGLPVGSTQRFHTVQPILSAEWEMAPQISLVGGTLHRNHAFLDAIFDDAMLFSRPVEQGFQLLVNRQTYQQDLFINWHQIETPLKPELFDVGYTGRLTRGVLALNGQIYWAHSGGAQYSEARSIILPGGPRNRSASNNFQAAVGPEVMIQPARYLSGLSWLREIDVMAMYLIDQYEPNDFTQPITRGRGYFLSTGLDIEGWRPYVNFWRGENYVTERGDPAYFAGSFTEFGFVKDLQLPAGFSLRIGGLARTMADHFTHTEYALLNWSWDGAPWRGSCLRPTLLHRSEQPCISSH